MMSATKYERNIYRIEAIVKAAFERAKATYPPESRDFERIKSFYTNKQDETTGEMKEVLNIYTNWFRLLEIHELNAVLVNIGRVSLSNRTASEQTARTPYEIVICAKGESTRETSQTILTAARVVREKLTAASNSFFECDFKEVSEIEVSPEKMSQGVDNSTYGIITFNITTREPLTDFADPEDGARINDTSITANDETYKMYLEW